MSFNNDKRSENYNMLFGSNFQHQNQILLDNVNVHESSKFQSLSEKSLFHNTVS
jgi:hypothetical protein